MSLHLTEESSFKEVRVLSLRLKSFRYLRFTLLTNVCLVFLLICGIQHYDTRRRVKRSTLRTIH